MSRDNSWKTAKAMTFKFSDLFLFTFFEKLNLIAWVDFFCIADLLDVGRKKYRF